MKLSTSVLLLSPLNYILAQEIAVTFDASSSVNQRCFASFLSYNIDTGSIYNGIDLTNPKFRTLVAQLAPSIIRIGGTAVDYSFYLPDSTNPQGGPAPSGSYTFISNQIWDGILDFIQATDMTLLWDFDSLQFRDSSNIFDPSKNATAFLEYTYQNYNSYFQKIMWSTGNEPDLWKIDTVNGTILGLDVRSLRSAVTSMNPNAKIFGPSYAGFNKEANEFFASVTGNLTGATFHNYPLARLCNFVDYLDRSHIDKLGDSVAAMVQTYHQSTSDDILLVLEETGGSYGGGCVNITDRFISGFWYLTTMGQVASNGFDRMHRQDIAGWSFTGGMSNYQLIGVPGWTNSSELLTPHPDYFTSLLFKQLVGTSVFTTTASTTAPGSANASFYVWSSTDGPEGLGGLTMLFANPTGNDYTVTVNGGSDLHIDFILTSTSAAYFDHLSRVEAGKLLQDQILAPPASLAADEVYLNGELMTVDANGNLPSYPISGVTSTNPITLPPYSYGFITLPNLQANGCTK
jgi:heparanase